MKDVNSPRLDLDFFEYVIAFNCTFNETYLGSVIDHLKLKYIENEHIRKYIEIIFDFFSKHQVCPNPTEIKSYLNTDDLKSSFKKVVTEFHRLDKKYNETELLQNTEQYLKERAIFFAVRDTVSEVTENNEIDTHAIYTRFEEACSISIIDDLGFDYFNNIDQHIKDLCATEKYISTGYKWLDKVLGGGVLETGRAVYNFVGATNSGKSIVLANLAANICEQGYTVVVITLEMSEMVYAKRITSKLTGIPSYELKKEAQAIRNYAAKFTSGHKPGRLVVKEFPPNTVTPNHIKTYLKNLSTKRGIQVDLVILDYLTLLRSSKENGSLYEDGKYIAEQIRALTYPEHFGCPFITAGQTNRQGYEENPTIEKTGESIAIPQTMDFQAVIWSNDDDKELGVLHVGLQKNRFGANRGQHAFRIDYDTLSITESDDIFGTADEIESIDSALEELGI